MSRTYLTLGSNLGDKIKYLEEAKVLIKNNIGEIVRSSSIYETEPWGFVGENLFLNQVMLVETLLKPFDLLAECQKTELTLGRVRNKERFTSRTIDIDILFYDNIILNTPELSIPHPEIPNRRFVLEPLAEIAPGFIHPVSGKSIAKILTLCNDSCKVTLLMQ
jgi:2-amino-4-hydroxy-6-hydroxymethyldihydropteridine diphosphokinase